MKIPVYIFTYNRLRYLQNAIQSVEKFYPHEKIYIVDDGSDQPEMLSFIEKNKNKYEFIFPNYNGDSPRGGLYGNLNFCICHAKEMGHEYVLFMPNDAQIVRHTLEEEVDDWKNCLEKTSDFCYSITSYFYPITEKTVNIEENIHVVDNYYMVNPESKLDAYRFNEFGMISISSFISLMGEHQKDEKSNQIFCKQKNIVCLQYCYPIGCRLPFQEYERKCRDKKAVDFLNLVSKRNFYPFENMTEEEIKKLKARNKNEIPYAEKWLRAPGVPQNIWAHWGESFGIEIINTEHNKELANKIFWIENNIEDSNVADKMIIELCEEYERKHPSNISY